jgi:thioredoxin reductase
MKVIIVGGGIMGLATAGRWRAPATVSFTTPTATVGATPG